MSYQIDVAYDLRQAGNVTQKNYELVKSAEENKCTRHYIDYEVWGGSQATSRRHVVTTFCFPEDNRFIAGFIRSIREKKGYHIESIGYDNCTFILLYASKTYLSLMEKDKMAQYLRRKKHILQGPHRPIIDALRAR
jgi:hypothetical protein